MEIWWGQWSQLPKDLRKKEFQPRSSTCKPSILMMQKLWLSQWKKRAAALLPMKHPKLWVLAARSAQNCKKTASCTWKPQSPECVDTILPSPWPRSSFTCPHSGSYTRQPKNVWISEMIHGSKYFYSLHPISKNNVIYTCLWAALQKPSLSAEGIIIYSN